MLVSNEIKSVEKKKALVAKKKYAKVDAETQTANEQPTTNFFSADAKNGINEKKKEELKTKARPLMINLEEC
jgi:hypothetical protein